MVYKSITSISVTRASKKEATPSEQLLFESTLPYTIAALKFCGVSLAKPSAFARYLHDPLVYSAQVGMVIYYIYATITTDDAYQILPKAGFSLLFLCSYL